MKASAILALFTLALALVQDDADILRAAKLKAVGDWVGPWNAEMVLLASEFKGLKMVGEVNVKWDLDNTALRFDGSAKPDPKTTGTSDKKLTFTGLLTFNHEGSEPGYSAVFSWSEDGRLVLAKGDFKGKELRMDLDIHPERPHSRLAVRVVGQNPRRIIVSIPASGSHKASDWIEITLRRP
jgi:hypothetical protein